MVYVLFVSILAVIQSTYGQTTTLSPGTTGSQTTASANVSTTSYPWFDKTTSNPSGSPSESPTTTAEPTPSPTLTDDPSASPSRSPTIGTTVTTTSIGTTEEKTTPYPWDTTTKPTPSPTYPVTEPTPAPSEPTKAPTAERDTQPASVDTPEPTVKPTPAPSDQRKDPQPASVVTPEPTVKPTPSPNKAPTKPYLIHAECMIYNFNTTKCVYGDDNKHSYRHEYHVKAHDLKNHQPICGNRMLKLGKLGWETCGQDTLKPRDLWKNYTCEVYCNTASDRYEFMFDEPADDFAIRGSIGMSVMAAVMAYVLM